MKRLFFFLALFVSMLVSGQIPAGYYDAANGLSGFPLKTALYNIIKNHTQISYSNLYNSYTTTDNYTGNKVWDMYSFTANGTAAYYFTNSSSSADQCGSYSGEGDCYNREHTTPSSWFNDATPMYSDLFNVYPTDGYVNNRRSNYPYGEVSSPTWTSSNGSKLGPCSFPGYSGVVFEPIDEFKGDFARTYFYMATRYENIVASWPSNSTECAAFYAGNNTTTFKTWAVNLLYQWHTEDPVSQKEIDRNNAVYGYQHNRNPYIDHPEWVGAIWGPTAGIDEKLPQTISWFIDDNSDVITFSFPNEYNNLTAKGYDLCGKMVFSEIYAEGPGKLEINKEKVGKGFFIFQFTDENREYFAKVVVL